MIVASRLIEKRSFLNDLLVMDEPEARSRRQFLVRLLGWGGVVGVAEPCSKLLKVELCKEGAKLGIGEGNGSSRDGGSSRS